MFDLDMELDPMSVLQFQDFVPEHLERNIWTGKTKVEPLRKALRDANAWILSHPEMDIINVETVVLPNIHSKYEEGSEDAELPTATLDGFQRWYQFIRVWYMDRG